MWWKGRWPMRQRTRRFLAQLLLHPRRRSSQSVTTSLDSWSRRRYPSYIHPVVSRLSLLEQHAVTEDHLDVLRDNIGAKWKRCARRLGLTSVEIETIEHDFGRDGLPEMVHQMLECWKMKEGSVGCTIGKLCQALDGQIKVDVIQKILDICGASQFWRTAALFLKWRSDVDTVFVKCLSPKCQTNLFTLFLLSRMMRCLWGFKSAMRSWGIHRFSRLPQSVRTQLCLLRQKRYFLLKYFLIWTLWLMSFSCFFLV